jgi:hypothetical protein
MKVSIIIKKMAVTLSAFAGCVSSLKIWFIIEVFTGFIVIGCRNSIGLGVGI